jgi:hypothetical protein
VTTPRPQGVTLTDNACGGQIAAFAYSSPGQEVVVLCSDSPKGALITNAGVTLDQWRQEADLRTFAIVQDKGVDFLGMYLSTKILHELMHVAASWVRGSSLEPSQCKSGLYWHFLITSLLTTLKSSGISSGSSQRASRQRNVSLKNRCVYECKIDKAQLRI